MNITTFTVEGPVLAARLPMPRPADVPVSPYPWDEFLRDMQQALHAYCADALDAGEAGEMLRHMADDGTCYWIRADLDDGTRYLRVFVDGCDPDEDDMSLSIEPCAATDVPGRIRLN